MQLLIWTQEEIKIGDQDNDTKTSGSIELFNFLGFHSLAFKLDISSLPVAFGRVKPFRTTHPSSAIPKAVKTYLRLKEMFQGEERKTCPTSPSPPEADSCTCAISGYVDGARSEG